MTTVNKIRLSNIAYLEMQLEKAWRLTGVFGATYREEVKARLALSLKNLYSDARVIEIYIPEYWENFALLRGEGGNVRIDSKNSKTKYAGQGHKTVKLDFLRRDIVRRQERIAYVKEAREREKSIKAKQDWVNSLSKEDQTLLACDIWVPGKYFSVGRSIEGLKAGRTTDSLADFKERLAALKQGLSHCDTK